MEAGSSMPMRWKYNRSPHKDFILHGIHTILLSSGTAVLFAWGHRVFSNVANFF
jgi:hypothetical protein